MALSPVALILQQDVQFFMYVYFYSIHVSDSHVTIITSWAHGGLKHVENRNIHTWKILHQVCYLQGSYQDARSTKHKILQQLWHISRWLLVSYMSVGMQQSKRNEPHLTHINTKHDKRRRFSTVFRSWLTIVSILPTVPVSVEQNSCNEQLTNTVQALKTCFITHQWILIQRNLSVISKQSNTTIYLIY